MKKETKVKTRFYNYWRIESSLDYGHTLSETERVWLQAFEREYYGGEACRFGIHPEEYKKSLFDAQNAGARDFYTASTEQRRASLESVLEKFKKCKRPVDLSRYYHPDDYLPDDFEEFEYQEFIKFRTR